jgi:hypothetical protein
VAPRRDAAAQSTFWHREDSGDQVREQPCSGQGGIGGTQRIQPAEALQPLEAQFHLPAETSAERLACGVMS